MVLSYEHQLGGILEKHAVYQSNKPQQQTIPHPNRSRTLQKFLLSRSPVTLIEVGVTYTSISM